MARFRRRFSLRRGRRSFRRGGGRSYVRRGYRRRGRSSPRRVVIGNRF